MDDARIEIFMRGVARVLAFQDIKLSIVEEKATENFPGLLAKSKWLTDFTWKGHHESATDRMYQELMGELDE